MSMFFNNPKVRDQLLRRGWVYTLRARRRRREGPVVLATGSRWCAQRLGTGWVSCVKEIANLDPRRLAPYVRDSGMPDGRSWIKAFESFQRGRRLPPVVYLYHVAMVEEELLHGLLPVGTWGRGDGRRSTGAPVLGSGAGSGRRARGSLRTFRDVQMGKLQCAPGRALGL